MDEGLLLCDALAWPDPLVIYWKGLYIAGGKFWRKVPDLILRGSQYVALYPDTLLTLLAWPISWLLMPGRFTRSWSRNKREE